MVTRVILMTMKATPTVMPDGEFTAKFPSLLDEVARGGRTLSVTKRGGPVAQVVPLPKAKGTTLVGSLVYEEEPFAPVHVRWDDNAGSCLICMHGTNGLLHLTS
jgi:prevent-host-death family protein